MASSSRTVGGAALYRAMTCTDRPVRARRAVIAGASGRVRRGARSAALRHRDPRRGGVGWHATRCERYHPGDRCHGGHRTKRTRGRCRPDVHADERPVPTAKVPEGADVPHAVSRSRW